MKLEELTALGVPNLTEEEWQRNRKKAVQIAEIKGKFYSDEELVKRVLYVSAIVDGDLRGDSIISVMGDFPEGTNQFMISGIRSYKVLKKLD